VGPRRQDQRLGPRQPALSRSGLQGPANDGWEIPWPIEYKDVAPYYDQVDQLIGVCGGDDDSDSLPGSKFHMPPPAPRCGEVLLSKGFAKTNIPIVPAAAPTAPSRCAVSGVPLLRQLRLGLRHRSFFCSADHLLPDAIKTGKLEMRSNAVVARVLVDDKGWPTACSTSTA
jgi:choline dehydrogenase-like flavoprotein